MSIKLNDDTEKLTFPHVESSASDIFHVVETHEAIAEFTRRLFHSDTAIQRESDPELACDYFVVSATDSGNVEDIADRNHEWHVGIRKIAGDLAQHYRLSLDVR